MVFVRHNLRIWRRVTDIAIKSKRQSLGTTTANAWSHKNRMAVAAGEAAKIRPQYAKWNQGLLTVKVRGGMSLLCFILGHHAKRIQAIQYIHFMILCLHFLWPWPLWGAALLPICLPQLTDCIWISLRQYYSQNKLTETSYEFAHSMNAMHISTVTYSEQFLQFEGIQ